ncbi:peptide/nickel transport system substrate-binding protein [Brevibacterium sanguinis]|uniref:Peptide/nickel transport system substrate-binding protein n=2 Tax=Brevibacterium TaxID=1696 RepID=A0A366IJV1_9MICO|nr:MULTISPECIES: ABC transporter substrate-binding protein [Brevibacterium]RBP64942.1 peptide/nickel transport system substrate-binding protein [Brevibacterium sanguinis]RBP71205.1 peptide/nickel transport system substrate-binding protein [Brevibacterium celere]
MTTMYPPSRRRFLGLGAALSLPLLLAACGDPAKAPGGGGTLRLGAVSGGGAPVADPHGQLFSEADWARLTALYDTLLVRGADGAAAAALATSWSANADATEWTLSLRDDAVFSSGAPVTASDVLYSLGRMVEKSAENGGRAGTVDIKGSEVVDDTTLRLATTAPDAELPLALTLGSFVVPEGTTDFAEPVGSGPFRLDTLDDQAAVLSANGEWWGGTPGVATLEIRGFSDPQALAQAATGGSIDVAAGVQPAAAKAAGSAVAVSERPGAEAVPLLLRVDAPPFDEPAVREAVKLGLDRQALVDQVYLGYGSVGRDMIRLDDPEVPDDVPALERDVERAKELLAEAGHPDGFDTVLHTSTAYPAMLPLATLAKEQLAEVGIRIEIEHHPPEKYWTEAYTVEPFTVGYYSVDSTTFASLVRATVLSSSSFSETGWKDAEFDSLFATAMSTTDDAARAQLIGDLHRRMAAEGGWVVWGFGDRLTLHSEAVSGLPEAGSRFDLSRVTLDA